MSRRFAAVTLLPLSLVLAGCAGTAAPDAAEPTSAASSTAGGTTGSTPATTPPAEPAGTELAVDVAGGQVTGDTGRVPVPLGDRVTVTITSDAPDEAHLHGYDVTADLAPGTPSELTFDATVPGVFELELHDAGTVLLTLQVS
ncbi:hypothetical protein DQ244_04290 [Blastococcus sp. TBT05-19]|uniref:hypothetical protein n=1 Tax=Blastococcus sp. TBT05-19 TaxID=2250581 RepID=UPI000DE8F852|nr:hypothetical protein [Blastococcus sp. TBT05-19]RBY94528.1 hypothetical protein DQ244_04290 [Blastococcus sp. TBT05-19]